MKELDMINAYKETGDNVAMQGIIDNHKKFIIKMANKYNNNTTSTDDLYQEGVIALIHAVKVFNKDKGSNLATIAYPRIARAVLKEASRYYDEGQSRELRPEDLIADEVDLDTESKLSNLTKLQKYSIMRYIDHGDRSNLVMYQIRKLREKFEADA